MEIVKKGILLRFRCRSGYGTKALFVPDVEETPAIERVDFAGRGSMPDGTTYVSGSWSVLGNVPRCEIRDDGIFEELWDQVPEGGYAEVTVTFSIQLGDADGEAETT